MFSSVILSDIWNYPRPDPIQSHGCSSEERWQGMGCHGLAIRVQGGAADSIQIEKRYSWVEGWMYVQAQRA